MNNMVSKSDALIIIILIFCAQFHLGLSAKKLKSKSSNDHNVDRDVKNNSDTGYKNSKNDSGSGALDFELNKYGLANGGKLAPAGAVIGNIIGTGSSITKRRGGMSGFAKLLDDRFLTIDQLGSPFGGLPEDKLGLTKFCAEFIYNGLFVLVFLVNRYPLKILMRAVLFSGALGFILTYANWCINPLPNTELTTNGRKINLHHQNIEDFKEQFEKRIIWITDRAQHMDRQMYYCCAFQEYKSSLYKEVPEAVDFLKFYLDGLYKLPEIIFCWEYQMGSNTCAKVDLSPTDQEIDRPVHSSFYTPTFELLDKYL